MLNIKLKDKNFKYIFKELNGWQRKIIVCNLKEQK